MGVGTVTSISVIPLQNWRAELPRRWGLALIVNATISPGLAGDPPSSFVAI